MGVGPTPIPTFEVGASHYALYGLFWGGLAVTPLEIEGVLLGVLRSGILHLGRAW